MGDVLPVPYINVIIPTAAAAVEATKNGKIGVIGTRATIGSCSYKKEIEKIDPKIQVIQRECPLFVPIVEEGFISPDDPIAKLTVERYLSDMKAQNVDTVILGCTHYPILKQVIGEFVGESVKLIDSGKETAIYASKLLKKENMLNKSDSAGECSFFVSDRTEDFTNTASIFLNSNIGDNVTRVDIWNF